MSSPPVLSGVRVTRSLVLYVCFVDRCLSFWPLRCLFFFDLRILITPLWYLQTLLILISINGYEYKWTWQTISAYKETQIKLKYSSVIVSLHCSHKGFKHEYTYILYYIWLDSQRWMKGQLTWPNTWCCEMLLYH